MNSIMNGIKNWIKSHPWQTVSFTGFNVFIASMAAYLPHLWVPCLVLFFLGLVIWALLFQLYRPLMVLLLAGLIALPPVPAKAEGHKKGGEVVIGVVVICVATYCVYRMARFCKQHFPPPPTNDVNNAFGAINNDGGTNFGASFTFESASCIDTPTTNFVLNPTTFSINAMVRGGQLVTRVSASAEASSMEEFISGLNAQGLSVGESYAVNGEPAPSSSVPIVFQPTTGTITNGVAGTAFFISVQCSTDMQNWQQLFTTTASEGTAFQVLDTVVAPSMFYRLEMQ